MEWLPDVNVLIALIDRQHLFHRTAREWFDREGHHGWISSPTTQNGAIRIMSRAAYGVAHRSPAQVAARLHALIGTSNHAFIADDVTLLDGAKVTLARMGTGANVTDAYLLALAVAHDARLVTLDQRVDTSVVTDGASHLLVIL